MLRRIVLGIALTLGACTTPQAQAEPGSLIIVGGGLEPDNEAVIEAFLSARPENSQGIAIIPAASGEPSASADSFTKVLIRHGAHAGDIALVRLALHDDPATEEIDEREWRDNANSPIEIAKLADSGAIWFTGGDQSRITELLIKGDGSDSPMLVTIRNRLAGGAVVGGTSAGAAIMSNPMIAQGDTLAALTGSDAGENLKLGKGLGFFSGVLVDQHFGERARLGRLAAALTLPGQTYGLGLGIDENTAIIVAGDQSTAKVAGSGYVTLINARSAKRTGTKRFTIVGLIVGLASAGDTIDIGTGAVLPADFKAPTVGNEYFDAKAVPGGGMALAGASLADVAGEGLIDNKAAKTIERHSFIGERGVTYQFRQSNTSYGWWGRGSDGTPRYALSGIAFDIEPIDINITKATD